MMDTNRLTGLGVALATPFKAPDADPSCALLGSGPINIEAFRRLVRSVAADGARGADFLVVLGSTGEGSTVLPAERDTLIRTAKEEARGLPVVVGTGHNATYMAVDLSRRAVECGADALLVVAPWYNKPQPAGIEAHFRAIAAAVPGTPIIAYNVPGRTGINIAPRDLARLWAIPQVVAVKESSGNLAQIGEIIRCLPEGKRVFSGDDALALPSIALGASGLISVIGNILPVETRALIDAALEGRNADAMEMHMRLLPIMDALFLESNPAPLKAALELAGLCFAAVRLPLVPASETTRVRLSELLSVFESESKRADFAGAGLARTGIRS